MKHTFSLLQCLAMLCITASAFASETLLLDGNPAANAQIRGENEYYSEIFNTEVVTNVSEPTLTPFIPAPGTANGVAVVIAPGGGFHALSINSEGNDVARWLNARGVTAFVLRYRLVQGGDDVVAEMVAKTQAQSASDMAAVAPLAGEDGLAAMRLVKARAVQFGIDPLQVGFMGFSAGGAVTIHVAHHYGKNSRPAFVVPVYAAARWLSGVDLPADAPPAFIVAASDDQLGLAGDSIALYQRWLGAEKEVELHMYARGGHGFGMRQQNTPSDHWIARFGEWLEDWRQRQ